MPPEKTIARVLLDNGVDVPLSCKMGLCGPCLTPVLAGEPDHRDTVQTEAEKSAPLQQIALVIDLELLHLQYRPTEERCDESTTA
nr:Phenoxybenzoate dioxygenase subunit beta [Candidatus Pantoea persica]